MGRRGKRSAARSAKRAAVFHKTKMCPLIASGTCTRGELCPFAHDEEELKAPPDLSCTKLCRTWLSGGVCQNPRCRHAHSMEELRAPSDEQGKRQHQEEDYRLDSVEEGDLVDEEDHRDPDPAPIASFGPDHVVVVENTFLNVRPTTPELCRSRRAKSTPASSSRPALSPSASSGRRGVKKAVSLTSGDETTTTSSEVEGEEELDTPPFPAATFAATGSAATTDVADRTTSLASSWCTEAWSSAKAFP
mmetsp:Transcript_47639/g.87546  ORF Transcript_47639/g.87546 Transcript_47639/m.87546 type:complete len:248 (-) Transcript_47639:41-784(-)